MSGLSPSFSHTSLTHIPAPNLLRQTADRKFIFISVLFSLIPTLPLSPALLYLGPLTPPLDLALDPTSPSYIPAHRCRPLSSKMFPFLGSDFLPSSFPPSWHVCPPWPLSSLVSPCSSTPLLSLSSQKASPSHPHFLLIPSVTASSLHRVELGWVQGPQALCGGGDQGDWDGDQ